MADRMNRNGVAAAPALGHRMMIFNSPAKWTTTQPTARTSVLGHYATFSGLARRSERSRAVLGKEIEQRHLIFIA